MGTHARSTAEVAAFDRPTYFRDEMTRGAFRSPLGPLGWLVDALFLTGYMRRLLEKRCEAIKEEVEAVGQAHAEAGAATDLRGR